MSRPVHRSGTGLWWGCALLYPLTFQGCAQHPELLNQDMEGSRLAQRAPGDVFILSVIVRSQSSDANWPQDIILVDGPQSPPRWLWYEDWLGLPYCLLLYSIPYILIYCPFCQFIPLLGSIRLLGLNPAVRTQFPGIVGRFSNLVNLGEIRVGVICMDWCRGGSCEGTKERWGPCQGQVRSLNTNI